MTPTKQQILDAVIKHFGVEVEYIFDRDRSRERVYIRQITSYLLLNDSVGTFEKCIDFIIEVSGQRFNHTTLLSSRDKIHIQKNVYPNLRKDIELIRSLYPKKPYSFTQFQNTTGASVVYI